MLLSPNTLINNSLHTSYPFINFLEKSRYYKKSVYWLDQKIKSLLQVIKNHRHKTLSTNNLQEEKKQILHSNHLSNLKSLIEVLIIQRIQS